METIEQHAGELLRGQVAGKIRTPHVTDEQGIAGEHSHWPIGLFQIGNHDRDAFDGVSRSFKEAQMALAESQLVAIFHWNVGKRCASRRAEIDCRASERRQLAMPGNEIGMQVCFDDVLNGEIVFPGLFEIDANVTLGIDYGRDAFGPQHVGGVGQAAEIKLLEIHKASWFLLDRLKSVPPLNRPRWHRLQPVQFFTSPN